MAKGKGLGRASHAKGTGGTTANGAVKGAIVSRQPRKAQMPRTSSKRGSAY